MFEALDEACPGANSRHTLLYGVEVKFYNMEGALDQNLETPHKGLLVNRRENSDDTEVHTSSHGKDLERKK